MEKVCREMTPLCWGLAGRTGDQTRKRFGRGRRREVSKGRGSANNAREARAREWRNNRAESWGGRSKEEGVKYAPGGEQACGG